MMPRACHHHHVHLVAVFLVLILARTTTCTTSFGAEAESVADISVFATTRRSDERSRKRRLQSILQVPVPNNYTTRSMDYGYTIYSQDALIQSADAIVKFREQALNAARQLVQFNPKVRIASLNETVVESCTNFDPLGFSSTISENGTKVPAYSSCNHVTSKITVQMSPDMNPYVVQEAILVQIQATIESINNQTLQQEYLVDYEYPTFPETVLQLECMGMNALMDPTAQKVFTDVFVNGFGFVMKTKAIEPPMTLREAKIIYQQLPITDATTSSSSNARFLRRRRHLQEKDSSPKLLVNFMVRSLCTTSFCTPEMLMDFILSQADTYSKEWVNGIQTNAQTMGIASVFAALNEIRFFDAATAPSQQVMPASTTPAVTTNNQESTSSIPMWLWIILGVDGFILLVSLLWVVCLKKRNRRKKNPPKGLDSTTNNNNNKPKRSDSQKNSAKSDPDEFPSSTYPNMAGARESAGLKEDSSRGNDDDFDSYQDQWKNEDDVDDVDDAESESNHSERIFDDGIRVRKVQNDSDAEEDNDHDAFGNEDSVHQSPSAASSSNDRVFDDGIRVRKTETDLTDDDDLSSSHDEETRDSSRVFDDGIRVRKTETDSYYSSEDDENDDDDDRDTFGRGADDDASARPPTPPRQLSSRRPNPPADPPGSPVPPPSVHYDVEDVD